MSSDRLSEIFDVCVTRMAAGATVEQCLRDYPGDTDGLRPLLETVTLMRRALPPAQEVIAAQGRGRAAMMAAVRTLPVARRRRASVGWLRTLASAAALILVLLGAATYAAESALPGDPLYPVKLVSEAVRMSITHDPALASAFAQRRITEVKTVLADGRQVAVNFAGQVETMSGSRWQVSGIPVEVSSTTEMTEPITAGDEVIVEGFASAGFVRAGEIERLTPRQVVPTPVFTPTQSPSPTVAPSSTPLPSLTPRATELSPAVTEASPTSCPATPPVGWVSYTLRVGDTLSELAAVTSITLDQLLAANCLTMADARGLVVGETISLPFTPPTPLPRATTANSASAAQPANNVGSGDDGSGHDSGDSQDDHGGDSGNSGSGSNSSGSDDGGSDDHGGSDNSGSDGGSGDSGSGGHGSDDGGSGGHGSDDD